MTNFAYHPDGAAPESHQIFVFGSNMSGVHRGGAALAANLHYGANWGVTEGPTGRSYALPTVKEHIAGPLPRGDIAGYVCNFIEYAKRHTEVEFFVTRVGCGLAGHKDEDIAPMFRAAPPNCVMPEPWRRYLGD